VATRTAEVGVVGAGVIGLAAADALAQAGTEVVCFDPRPGSGQSAGLTRVFRHVHDQPELVALAQEARQLWDEWSRRAATPLVGDEGVLFAGPGARESAELLTSASVEHRLVGEEEQRELLPALSPPTPAVLFEAGGGAIRVRPTIELLVSSLGKRLVREEVIAVRLEGDGVTLFTPEGIWRCGRVLVCAGARTHELAMSSRPCPA
jgi:sarcosine oxidase